MSRQQTAVQSAILLEHGSGATRLFTNPTTMAWVGRKLGNGADGSVILAPGAHPIRAGLIEGSSDVIGIHGPDGRFVAIEVKTAGYNKRPAHQKAFLRMVLELGGLAGFARSAEDAGRILAGEALGV